MNKKMNREMNRHKKYKDSGIPWIGEIPKDWEVVRLKTIFYEYNKKSLFGSEELLSLSQYTGIRLKSDTSIAKSYEAENYEGYRIVKSGQFVMNIMLAWNGSYALSEYDGMISPAYCVYDFRIDCHRKYYHYLLKIEGYQIAFKTMSRGIIDSRLRLYPEQFYTFSTLTPPISNQRAIADFLDVKCAEVDELIALQGKMIDELKVYKQSVITEAVTKGLNPDAPLKDSGIEWIGHIPEHWSIERLKNRIELNPSINPTKIDSDTIVSFMPMECLRNAVITPKTASYSDVRTYTPFQEQDIVMAKVTPCYENGNIAIATDLDNGFGFGTSEIFVIRCNLRINNNYLFYYLQSSYAKNAGIASMTGTGGLKRVNPTALSCSRLLCPPIKEQQQIADYLDTKCAEIDEMTNIKQQKIEQLKEYKKSIIYEYVTGKKQVNIE